MPPQTKKIRLINNSIELLGFQNEIRKINNLGTDECNEKSRNDNNYSYIEEDEETDEGNDNTEIKRFIRGQIKQSERKIRELIERRIDRLERKINRLLEKKFENNDTSNIDHIDKEQDFDEEEHLIEYVNEGEDQTDELNHQIFPICDENTFDWFMERLKDEQYRENLVCRRYKLTRDVGMKSFNVSVKDFLLMHFQLAVCIKYSVSGYGSRGTKKKKLDSPTLTKYIFECFNKTQPGINTYHDVSKAITQFWGRSNDTFTKANERLIKREMI